MTQSVIGAQMFTLRQHTQTESEMIKTCKKVKKMGYDAIQVSAFGRIETSELAKIFDGEGLVCAATHVSLELMSDVNACVEYHEALKCKYPAIGGAEELHGSPSEMSYRMFAKRFSNIGAALVQHGLKVGYHNHSHELAHFGGQVGLDILIEQTNPNVWFEIDTYWIVHGGGDPAAWIEKLKGRVPCIHVKDMTMTPKRQQLMCEVGDGNLNWPRILDACRAAGVQWYLVERDDGELDPFDSLRRSLENLRAMGLP